MWNYGFFSYMILKKCSFSEGFVSILSQGPPPADNSCRVNIFLSTSCCVCNWASVVILDNFAGFARLFCVLLCFAPLYTVLNFDFIVSVIFLLPHKFPCCSEHVCIPEQCPVCYSSIPQVGKALRVHRYLVRLPCISDSAIQTQKTSENGRADFQLPSPQDPSTDKNSHRRLCLKNADENTWEITTGMLLILCYFTSQFCVGQGTICCKFQRTRKQFT